jgi:type II restriction/modification system DNA methylase subunit YeeA
VDFGDMPETDAAFFEMPFQHVIENVKPGRMKVNREKRRKFWWQHGETAPGLYAALAVLPRFIATPRVAKYRFFVWLDKHVLPDSRLCVIARDIAVAAAYGWPDYTPEMPDEKILRRLLALNLASS